MPTFHLNKLVRDKIVQHQIDAGETVDFEVRTGRNKLVALVRKLTEETGEILDSDSPAAELADAQQAIDDMAAHLGVTREQIADAQARKFAKNGGFSAGYFVKSVTCDEDDEWTAYYRREPERFPETD